MDIIMIYKNMFLYFLMNISLKQGTCKSCESWSSWLGCVPIKSTRAREKILYNNCGGKKIVLSTSTETESCTNTRSTENIWTSTPSIKTTKLLPIDMITTLTPGLSTSDIVSDKALKTELTLFASTVPINTFNLLSGTTQSTKALMTSANSEMSDTFTVEEPITMPSQTATPSTTVGPVTPTNVQEVSSSMVYGEQLLKCSCPCSKVSQENKWVHLKGMKLTYEELREIMKIDLNEIKERLTVPKNTTSSYLRRKKSISDRRKSSAAIGSVGIFVICLSVITVVIFDIIRLLQFLKTQRKVKINLAPT